MQRMFEGFLPALVTPFHDDGRIDEASLGRVVERVRKVDGVTGVVVNGHAGEVTSLSREERRLVVERTASLLEGSLPVVSGIATETPGEAVQHALDAQGAGAEALLILPPHVWLLGVDWGSETEYFRALDKAVGVPLIVFQYPARWGGRYAPETLLEITSMTNVAAVKDASWEISDYEEDYRLLKSERPDIFVLSANDEHVLTSFVIGADGALLGFGSVATHLIAPMLEATKRDDLKSARAFGDRLYPLTKAFYKTQPRARMHSRIKYALSRLEVIESAMVRQPLLPLSHEERGMVDDALQRSGLL